LGLHKKVSDIVRTGRLFYNNITIIHNKNRGFTRLSITKIIQFTDSVYILTDHAIISFHLPKYVLRKRIGFWWRHLMEHIWINI
jgi:hypothetical protein